MNEDFSPVLDQLRAAGEPTRLRILSLLRQRDLSVGELVQILDQSQPRLSHHLKALTQAGLVERLPEGSFVFYRAITDGGAGAFLDHLFNRLSADSRVLVQDHARLVEVTQSRQKTAEAFFSKIAAEWDELRALHYPDAAIEHALKDIIGPKSYDRLVDFGTGTGRILTVLAPNFREAEGIDFNHHMLTIARANIEKAGISHGRVRQGDVTCTPFGDETVDVVTIHQVLHFMDTPQQAIMDAARILIPGGRLVVVDFAPHALEFLRTEHGHHRLGISTDRMREWFENCGLEATGLRTFYPPDDQVDGLTVNIWTALKPDHFEEAAQ